MLCSYCRSGVGWDLQPHLHSSCCCSSTSSIYQTDSLLVKTQNPNRAKLLTRTRRNLESGARGERLDPVRIKALPSSDSVI